MFEEDIVEITRREQDDGLIYECPVIGVKKKMTR